MFGKPIKLFRLAGVDVRIDFSWFLLVLLITWSLAVGFFPMRFPGLSTGLFWALGFAGAMGLFLSILLHEISHSVVGRAFGMKMEGITLFLLGGVAEMPREPQRPKAEFWMAIAGPLTSLALAALFLGVNRAGAGMGWPAPWMGIFGYLSFINVVLAVFNLVPAFPLDGGRVFRSLIWAASGDYTRATRLATAVGSGFGLVLILLGAISILSGNPIGGLWWVFIGLFVRVGARASMRQLTLSRLLADGRVRDIMNPDPITVPPEMPVHRLVEDYLYKYDYKVFPVTDGGRLLGCVGLDQVKGISRTEWDERRVGEVMTACPSGTTLSAEAGAEEALAVMSRTGASPLLVTENDSLKGIVTSRDLMHRLSTKMELEKPFSGPMPRPA